MKERNCVVMALQSWNAMVGWNHRRGLEEGNQMKRKRAENDEDERAGEHNRGRG
jgi:hypothetical protein